MFPAGFDAQGDGFFDDVLGGFVDLGLRQREEPVVVDILEAHDLPRQSANHEMAVKDHRLIAGGSFQITGVKTAIFGWGRRDEARVFQLAAADTNWGRPRVKARRADSAGVPLPCDPSTRAVWAGKRMAFSITAALVMMGSLKLFGLNPRNVGACDSARVAKSTRRS